MFYFYLQYLIHEALPLAFQLLQKNLRVVTGFNQSVYATYCYKMDMIYFLQRIINRLDIQKYC